MWSGELTQYALGIAAVCSAISLAIVRSQAWHGRLSLDHDLAGVQKMHSTPVPRIGGLAVFVSMLIVVLYTRACAAAPFAEAAHFSFLLMLCGLPAFISGLLEDFTKKVSVLLRLQATLASAFLASLVVGATLTRVDIPGLDLLLGYLPCAIVFTVLFVGGGTNAINIIDGFNGLAGTAVIIISAGLAVIAWQAGDMLVFQLALAAIGAAFGFVLVNYPKGSLFLGDGGAYFLGFWIGELAVLLLARNASVNAWQVLGVCAYPIIELLFSMYRRKVLHKRSPGAPDGLHLHTLIYKRFVKRRMRHDPSRPWLRNAAAGGIVAGIVLLMMILAVSLGDSLVGAVAVVCVDVVVYCTIYRRLVRGRQGLLGASGNR
jgi:UDP-N-acetylmuramyl pentapeptide phosphotransferase/UDP-N-acetylglucosamine-1-phosphate transferase